jgi:hypothetical protein
MTTPQQPQIPSTIPEEDTTLLENVLTALRSLSTGNTPTCSKYKIDVAPTCYVVRAILPSSAEHFEIHLDDLLFIQSVGPARIEHVAITKRPPSNTLELIVRVLDCKQRIMVASSVSFHATRKRKWVCASS